MYKRRLWILAFLLVIGLAADPLAAPAARAGSAVSPSICEGKTGTGKIAGKVTLPGGAPQSGVVVTVYTATGRYVSERVTNEAGEYAFSGLPAGDLLLHVAAPNNSGYAAEWFNNQGDPSQATPVTLPAGGSAEVNFELALGTQFAGRVTTPNGSPLAGVYVAVYDRFGDEVAHGETDANGEYVTTPGLSTGAYRVLFDPPLSELYLAEYYPDTPTLELAQPISVTAPTPVTGLDATLQRAGQITGRLTYAATGEPVHAYVYIYGEAGFDYAETDAEGNYASHGLRSGAYRVGFIDGDPDYYTPERLVAVTAPNVTANVNGVLVPGGQIRGHVTDSNGSPATGADVSAYATSGFVTAGDAKVDASGAYTITGLASGAYQVGFYYAGHLGEYYNDKPSWALRDLVPVTAPNTTTGIDAALAVGGGISGTVHAAESGYPLPDVLVIAYTLDGAPAASAQTDADGHYLIPSLPTGSYQLKLEPEVYGLSCAYVPKWFDNQADPSAASTVQVEAPNVTGGVDAVLERGSVLAGQVTDANTQLSIYDALVTVFDQAGQVVASGFTNEVGHYYTMPALPSGVYYLHFADDDQGYLDEYYSDAPTLAAAQPVTVTAPDDVTGLNAALSLGGSIAGRVTAAGSGQGLHNVKVTVYDGAGQPVAAARTNVDGTYIVLAGLPTGSYRVGFGYSGNSGGEQGFAAEVEAAIADAAQRRPGGPWTEPGFAPRVLSVLAEAGTTAALASASGYMTQFYNNQLSLSQATLVPVTASQTTSGIDAVLQQGLFLPVIRR